MFMPRWLSQIQRCWFPRQSSNARNSSRRASAQRWVRLSLEPLEDRLVPSADSVQSVASNVSASFSTSQQSLTLTANVSDTTHTSTTVSEGTVTFTVKDSSGNTIGTAVQGTVSGGKVTASFSLPSDEAAGSYTIDVSYADTSGSTNFTDGGDTSATLTVNAATVKVVGGDTSATFSSLSQSVTLTANLTDDSFSSETVNEGKVTFTVKDSSGNTIGSSVDGTVSDGKATATFTLPAGEAVGNYTVDVAYSDSSGNFSDDGTNTSGKLTVGNGTTTQTSNATASFSTSSQTVTLTATVTSSSGTVNEGSVLFEILQGTTVIGTATSGNVSNGSASVTYTLPGGTDAGTYTIEAVYSDSGGTFASSSDTSHQLTVSSSTAASTTTTASNKTATFGSSSQTVTLSATVTSVGGTVDEGIVVFTILDGTTVVGTATSGNVYSGSASASFSLPADTVPGTYTIEANYTDSAGKFAISSDTTHTLTVSAASTTTSASSVTATFKTSSQTVTLTATVTSSEGTVNEGSLEFKLLNSSGDTIGTAISANVSDGSASVTYTLPAGTAKGSYTIEADYTDSSGNFASSSEENHYLTVSAASTTTTGADVTVNFSSSAQKVTLTATVTSSSGTVNEGDVLFTIVDSNGNTIGKATSGSVSNGSVSVSYTLPGATAAGSYTIEADYSDSSSNFDSSDDTTHTLSISVANSTSLSLTSVSINPDLAGGTAQLTLTAQVSNPGGTVNEGVLSITVGGVSGQANVSNGAATVQLSVSISDVLNGFTVSLSYTDNASAASFSNSSASDSVETSKLNALLPSNLTFGSSDNESMQFNLGGMSFGASYSSSTGLLSGISVGSLSVPVTYTNLGTTQVATVGGLTLGIIFRDGAGNFMDIADVETSSDGSLLFVVHDAHNNVIGEFPYEG